MRINSSIQVVYIWNIASSLSDGYPWLSLVILCFPWLPHDYLIWPRLQKISANDGKNNCKCVIDYTYIGIIYNQG